MRVQVDEIVLCFCVFSEKAIPRNMATYFPSLLQSLFFLFGERWGVLGLVVHHFPLSDSDRGRLVHDEISMAPEIIRVAGLLIMLVGAAAHLARKRSLRAGEPPRARARKRNPRGSSKPTTYLCFGAEEGLRRPLRSGRRNPLPLKVRFLK